MEEYKIYCTEEQVKKILSIDESLLEQRICDSAHMDAYSHPEKYFESDGIVYVIPTAEEMIGWLEEQYVRVYVQPYIDECDTRFKGKIRTVGEHVIKDSISRKEATLAAIDAALEYLCSKK